MKVAYIAGPFRAKNQLEVERNIRRAEEIGYVVAELGMMPLIPHANTRFLQGTKDDEFWLEGTKELLKRCDLMVMIDRDAYKRSDGTQGELTWARSAGMPIKYFDGEKIVDWR